MGQVHPDALPPVESMRDCMNRTVDFWKEHIIEDLRNEKELLIVSHKNSLKALFYYIQGLRDEDFKNIDVPNAVPIVYEFNQDAKFL